MSGGLKVSWKHMPYERGPVGGGPGCLMDAVLLGQAAMVIACRATGRCDALPVECLFALLVGRLGPSNGCYWVRK